MGMANFDSRKTYFDSVGEKIQDAQNLEQAIKIAGLDFNVVKEKLYVQKPLRVVSDSFATIREDTKEVLGIVGKNYNILQNKEAFDFLDDLIVGGAKFETAGTFKKNTASSFITCSTETIKILDDDIAPYILFTNSFDGTGSIRVMLTPVRLFCSNCIARANKAAINKICIRHSNNMKAKLEVSREILLQNTKYLEALKQEAEKLAVTPFSTEAFESLARELFPIKEDASECIVIRNEAMIEQLLLAYNQQDLQNFNNTAYKAVQAVSDFESHKPQFKKGKEANLANIKTVMLGMPLLNLVADRMNLLI